MVRNTLPLLVVFLILRGNSGIQISRFPRIQRETLGELEALINNAQRTFDTIERINSLADIKKISEIVDNFSA